MMFSWDLICLCFMFLFAGIGVNVGDMLTKRPHYLQKSVEQLRKSKPRLLADFKQRGGAKLAAVAAEESE